MASSCLRAAIRLVIIGLVLGYSMMWIMLPTKTYKYGWQPKLIARLSSAYFGTQEMTTLIFTLPAVLAAVLSCIYLHLATNAPSKLQQQQLPVPGKSGDGGEKRILGSWRKPMVVKGPLGIVTGIEMSFLTMVLLLLLWSLYNYFNNSFRYITRATSGFETVWELKLDLGGLWLGLVGNICLTLLFFPVARWSSVLAFFGLTSEGSIKYHIWLGHTVMIFFTAHGICYIVHWAITHQMSETLKWVSITGISNLAGEISLLAGLGLWATTFPRIRRKMFELFFYTHYLYILFVIFFVFHVGFSYACYMLPSFYLFLVDRYLRFLQSRQLVPLVSSRILPAHTLELNFSKSPGLTYSPTSVLFVNVPSISKLQWHPFTISSNSNLEPDKLSVVIKGEGRWTKKLYQLVSSPAVDRLQVSVEGPYGPYSTDFLRHETLVMVSGGSGITPFISVIRELIHISSNLQLKTPQVILISSFKNSSDLTILNLIQPINMMNSSPSLSSLRLTILAYITREKQPPTNNNNLMMINDDVQAKWFKPCPTDTPIANVLGPTRNSWLWLAAIVASSFVAFLIMISLITRYYIYKEAHKSTRGFPVTLTALIYMLVLCVCIVVAASVAVVWNKRRNATGQTVQIRNMEVGAPPMAGSSAVVVDDGGGEIRELESLPVGCVLDVTTLHYGARPNLKKLLVEYCTEGEGSTGVLASGPATLRHQVATICSSGLADDNLHFESISFSW